MNNDKNTVVYLRPFYSTGILDDWASTFHEDTDVTYETHYLEILETLIQTIKLDDSEYKSVMDYYTAAKQFIDISNINLYDLTPLYTTLRFITNAESAIFLKLKYPHFIAVKGDLHDS